MGVGVPVISADGDSEGVDDKLGECDDEVLDGDALGVSEGNELGLSVGDVDGAVEGVDVKDLLG